MVSAAKDQIVTFKYLKQDYGLYISIAKPCYCSAIYLRYSIDQRRGYNGDLGNCGFIRS